MCVLLGFLQKNIGDPYSEPTIVVHDMLKFMSCSENTFVPEQYYQVVMKDNFWYIFLSGPYACPHLRCPILSYYMMFLNMGCYKLLWFI